MAREEYDAAEFLAKALGTSLIHYMPATEAKFRAAVDRVIRDALNADQADVHDNPPAISTPTTGA